MRKPRDFDSELKALTDKTRQLKERRVRQLGELVVACGADVLDADTLAGALLAAAAMKDATTKEGWRRAGVAFFQRSSRSAARGPHSRARSAAPDHSGTLPLGGERGTQ